MKKGVLLFAYNSKQLDYGLLAVISAGLAKKHLKVPVSLVTDKSTIEWLSMSSVKEKAEEIFENIIITDRPETNNTRILNDGNSQETIPFINSNRSSVWDLTPYDTTLMIDSDFLIFSDRLSQYWDLPNDLMISTGMKDIAGHRVGFLDKHISPTGVKMFWATTVMFKKTDQSKLFFDTVKHIKNNYQHYADLFRFDARQYRNDISFSVAKHILDGFREETENNLPEILTTIDKDMLYTVSDQSKLIFLLNESQNFSISSVANIDIHVMNKQSILRNSERLLKLI